MKRLNDIMELRRFLIYIYMLYFLSNIQDFHGFVARNLGCRSTGKPRTPKMPLPACSHQSYHLEIQFNQFPSYTTPQRKGDLRNTTLVLKQYGTIGTMHKNNLQKSHGFHSELFDQAGICHGHCHLWLPYVA